MSMHDANHDGKISLAEFKGMMLGYNIKEDDTNKSLILEK
jgi:hypothetical protein